VCYLMTLLIYETINIIVR